jgi:hypothetical protein
MTPDVRTCQLAEHARDQPAEFLGLMLALEVTAPQAESAIETLISKGFDEAEAQALLAAIALDLWDKAKCTTH